MQMPVRIASFAAALLAGLAFARADEVIRMASSASLSPNGERVAFSWRGDIWTAPSGGGVGTRVTDHPGLDGTPRFSPDGARIAFVSDRGQGSQVFVVRAVGGEPRPVTFDTNGVYLVGWYPDGERLLVRAATDRTWYGANRLFSIPVEGRAAPRMLFDAYCGDAALSPDGTKVLFVREGVQWWRKGYEGSKAGQIWLFDAKTGAMRRLLGDGIDHRWPCWRPDGESFLYVGGESGTLNLMRYDFRTGASAQVTEFPDDTVVAPAISADGSTIVFRHLFDFYRLRPGKSEVPRRLRFAAIGDKVTPETEKRTVKKADAAAFSADGLEVVFAAGGDLWVMDTVLREPRRITDTPEEERSPVLLPDGSAVLYFSDREGRSDLWRAERADGGEWWWRNDEFRITRLTDDDAWETALSVSPDGKRIAFVRNLGDLVTADPDGGNEVVLMKAHNQPGYDWSPDSRYIAYAVDDADSNRDVFIVPAGGGEAVNVSRHPDDEGNPAWSPDGKLLAFVGERWDRESDVHYVWLREEDEEESKSDRKLEEALEKMGKARKGGPGGGKAAPKSPPPGKPDPVKPDPVKPDPVKPDPAKADPAKADPPEKTTPPTKPAKPAKPEMRVEIDFDGIHARVRRTSIPDTKERGLVWSPDGKKLAFTAKIDGRRGTYTVTFPDDLKPKLLTTTVGSAPLWIKPGNQILWLVGGVPASSVGSKTTAYAFQVRQIVDRRAHLRAAFDRCWSLMRDWFYDEAMNNRNWDEIRRKYREAASAAPDLSTFARIVSLMLGELNGSHVGFSAARRPETWRKDGWSVRTAHLGVRFDPAHTGPGLRVADVIPRGPADRVKSRLRPGEAILTIDGTTVDPAMDLTLVLNVPPGHEFELDVRDAEGAERTVRLRPTSLGAVRGLLYEQWRKATAKKVEELSKGTLGYLHVRAMHWGSFQEFERELYAAGYGKDGLVIDVRNNGGGYTADHLLTALMQPVHAVTTQRGTRPGYPQDRRVYANWAKPIVVLVNQNSFSNAEIFAHAVKTLGRGRIVGVASAGGVISTSGRRVMDVGTIRIPLRGWYVLDTGEDMERNGVEPDFVIWPEPGELPAGIDRQLEKAVQVLAEDVETWKQRPVPKLRKASER